MCARAGLYELAPIHLSGNHASLIFTYILMRAWVVADPNGSYFMRELVPRCSVQQRLLLLAELGMHVGGWGPLACDDIGVPMRAPCHRQPCTAEIYLRIDARMADDIRARTRI